MLLWKLKETILVKSWEWFLTYKCSITTICYYFFLQLFIRYIKLNLSSSYMSVIAFFSICCRCMKIFKLHFKTPTVFTFCNFRLVLAPQLAQRKLKDIFMEYSNVLGIMSGALHTPSPLILKPILWVATFNRNWHSERLSKKPKAAQLGKGGVIFWKQVHLTPKTLTITTNPRGFKQFSKQTLLY